MTTAGDGMKIIDSYVEMTPKEIAKTFEKTINAVNVGISRMVKEHPDFKKKEGKRVTITPAGVEWLATKYFNIQTQLTVPDPEKDELKREVARLNELLKQAEDHFDKFAELSKLTLEEKINQHQIEMKGVETKNKELEDTIHLRDKELETAYEELSKYKKKKFLGFEYYIKG